MPRTARPRVPTPVWLILGLYLLVIVGQTAVFPNFRAPDEREHVDLIVAVAHGDAWPWPDPGTLLRSKGIAAGGFTTSNRIPGQLHLSDKNPPPRGERPSYLDAGGADVTGQPSNQLVQHPPLYYFLGAAVLSAYPDWENAPFDRVFLVLRLWNALIMAAVPILLWATARRLKLPEPVPIAAALVPLSVPEFTHLPSSVNDDNLLILLAAGLTLLVARVLTGDTGRGTAVGIGALASLALLTKGLALMIPAWVGLAYLVAAVRSRHRTALMSLAIAELATVPGLLWWIRNEVLYGAVQPNGYVVEQPDLTSRFGWSDGGPQWLRTFVDRMVTLFFVHDQTGQQLHHGPWRMAYVALALGVVAVVTVLAWPVLPRMTTAVLLVPAAALAAIVVTGSWDVFAATQAYGGMQGRYLYSGLAGLGVVAVAAGAVLPRQVRRFLPLVLFGFACVIQVVYLTYTLNLFWAPSGSSVAGALREIVRAMAYWYPLPGPLLGVFGGLLAALVVAVTAAVARIAVAVPYAVASRPALAASTASLQGVPGRAG